MHSPEDIDFIEISDLTAMVDDGPLILVSNIDIVVDVFHLLNNKEDFSPSADSPRGHDLESQNNDENQDLPHPKVINLPSEDLHGLWKSCAGLSPPFEISSANYSKSYFRSADSIWAPEVYCSNESV